MTSAYAISFAHRAARLTPLNIEPPAPAVALFAPVCFPRRRLPRAQRPGARRPRRRAARDVTPRCARQQEALFYAQNAAAI